MKRTGYAIAIAICIAAGAAPAAADNAKAEALFKKGKRLLEEGEYAEACAAFEASQRAEATIGTRLNIGLCYEQWGKLATAYATYLQAQEEAEEAGDDRAARIAERAAELEPKVPTLIIRAVAEAKPVDLIVRLDAKDMPLGELGKPTRLDPGEHVVEYGVGDSKRKRVVVNLEAGDHEEVLLEKLAQMGAGGPVEEDLEGNEGNGKRVQLAAAPDPGKTRRVLGIVSGAAGLAAIGISSYVVMSARSDYREAKAAHCNAMNQCDAVGLEITRDARSKANVGTVLFIGGSVLVAGGVFLYLTAPERRIGETRDGGEGDEGAEEEALRWTPVITPDSAGFVVAGSF